MAVALVAASLSSGVSFLRKWPCQEAPALLPPGQQRSVCLASARGLHEGPRPAEEGRVAFARCYLGVNWASKSRQAMSKRDEEGQTRVAVLKGRKMIAAPIMVFSNPL